MEAVLGPGNDELAQELALVAEAAGSRLRGEVDGDEDASQSGAQALLTAATSAMNAGYSLSAIAQAEARGKAEVRTALQPDILKRVERTGRNVRAAQGEHHRTIGRAVRLGLSTRQIAAAAGVTHGTVRAIASRVSAEEPISDSDVESGEWSEQEPHEELGGDASAGAEQRPGERDGHDGYSTPDQAPHEHEGEGGW
ncbi:MAG: hypothetical protein ACR2L9_05250 [Solirubrobacteraceae bacterium]